MHAHACLPSSLPAGLLLLGCTHGVPALHAAHGQRVQQAGGAAHRPRAHRSLAGGRDGQAGQGRQVRAGHAHRGAFAPARPCPSCCRKLPSCQARPPGRYGLDSPFPTGLLLRSISAHPPCASSADVHQLAAAVLRAGHRQRGWRRWRRRLRCAPAVSCSSSSSGIGGVQWVVQQQRRRRGRRRHTLCCAVLACRRAGLAGACLACLPALADCLPFRHLQRATPWTLAAWSPS